MAKRWLKRLKVLVWLCLIMAAISIINWYWLDGSLNRYGIYPRHLSSFPFIFSAPFLHAGWAHLLGNLLGLAIFGGLCLLRGVSFFIRSSITIIVLSGLLVWILGRPAVHIGASGWVFGLWSLAIAQAWFERSLRNIVIAVLVVIFYGGMIFGVLPSNPNISFEYHLFGALSGIVSAYWSGNRKKVLSST